MKKNLEQIRARNALKCAGAGAISGKRGGEVIKKIPPLILNHGLLATLAYAYGENEKGWRIVFDYVAQHLADREMDIVPGDEVRNHADLMDYLTNGEANSETLKLATAETLAWLAFARRFVRKEEKKSEPKKDHAEDRHRA